MLDIIGAWIFPEIIQVHETILFKWRLLTPKKKLHKEEEFNSTTNKIQSII